MPNRCDGTACTAYSRYVLDVGASEDWFALQVALLPCLLGYGMIAKRLHSIQDPAKPKEANRYRRWIDNYVAEDYTEAVRKGCGTYYGPPLNCNVDKVSLLVPPFCEGVHMWIMLIMCFLFFPRVI